MRILLDKVAANNLLEMLEEIKAGGDSIKITPSKLASWIVARYRKTTYKREIETIKRAHFDHQKYLKKALRGATTEEELREALTKAMRQVGRKSKRKKREITQI